MVWVYVYYFAFVGVGVWVEDGAYTVVMWVNESVYLLAVLLV